MRVLRGILSDIGRLFGLLQADPPETVAEDSWSDDFGDDFGGT